MNRIVLALPFLALACSPATPGASPHDMSGKEHESHAQQHEQAGAAHAAQYDPKATESVERCAPPAARRADAPSDACWSSTKNPTAEHLRMAQEHQRHAADHRAGSVALREAEARACVGIGNADRDMSPFSHIEDVESVAALTEPAAEAKAAAPETKGAVVTFRPIEGMTAEWLQRIIDCHLARNASLGHVVPEMPDCPLVPRAVEAKVSPAGSGFSVHLRASDPATARDVLARAERLTGRKASGK